MNLMSFDAQTVQLIKSDEIRCVKVAIGIKVLRSNSSNFVRKLLTNITWARQAVDSRGDIRQECRASAGSVCNRTAGSIFLQQKHRARRSDLQGVLASCLALFDAKTCAAQKS